MKRPLVFLLCASVLFLSCKDNQIWTTLISAEINMIDNPESSLEILESVDKERLSTRKQKAKYALLYSIALDKNFIDIDNDSIIAPAVTYYEYYGSKEDRFLSKFYHARTYENAGDNKNALICTAKAESIDTSKVNAEFKCLLYALKGRIYHKEWRTQEAIEAYTLASRYTLLSKKYRHYAYYALKLADMYRYDNDFDNSYKSVLAAEKFKSYFLSI